jgi:hypothetical protein
MRPLSSILLLYLLAALFIAPSRSSAQRARLGKVHSLQATSDKSGEHPASTEISGPATVTCINGASETPNTQVSCSRDGPGFFRSLEQGQVGKFDRSGNGDSEMSRSRIHEMRRSSRRPAASEVNCISNR